MFEHLGWFDVANMITRSLEETIAAKIVTYDFARAMDGATEVSTGDVDVGMSARVYRLCVSVWPNCQRVLIVLAST